MMIIPSLFIGLFAMPCVVASLPGTAGKMKMWSRSETAVVGASCEYAGHPKGLDSPAAQGQYIKNKHYCAVNSALFNGGLACGRCYKIKFSGLDSDTTEKTNCNRAGERIIQVVNSGELAEQFDCQETVFEEISGCDTGVMDITYEQVDCEGDDSPTATVLDGYNRWYTRMIFSGLTRGVSGAEIQFGDNTPIAMSKSSAGGPWSVSMSPAAPEGNVDVTFKLTLDNGAVVPLTNCFSSWPQPTSASCTVNANGDVVTGSSSSSSTTTTSTTSTAAQSSNNGDCVGEQVGEWAKCAGKDYPNKCCTGNLECFRESEWYSQCLQSCPPGWECNMNGRRRNLRAALSR